MSYKKMLVNVTTENVDFLQDVKVKGQTITDTLNLALDTYRAMIADQTARRTEAARKQERAAQAHVDELFENMEFRTEAFKQAWVAAVLDRFDEYVDVI
jgi:hypothetical protein